ncbi:MAG: hypothetical protein H7Z40_16595 [Phycisphaerae bacterium]|nr:hypothetical protein [Gemmatimonadaceae bacterium]
MVRRPSHRASRNATGRDADDHASDGSALPRAFDELRFGADRTLNLRPLQPTAMQATRQVEQWLRLKQVEGATEVLLITGRGNQSIDQYSPVREAVVRLLPSLRRRNVIQHYLEHTAGSFVVEPAPLSALFDAPKRRRERQRPVELVAPVSLAALESETVQQLRELAVLTLAGLGVHSPSPAVLRDEMQHQFTQLTAGIPAGANQEAVLQQAIQRAAEEFER